MGKNGYCQITWCFTRARISLIFGESITPGVDQQRKAKRAHENGASDLTTPVNAKTRLNAEEQVLANYPDHRILDIQMVRDV